MSNVLEMNRDLWVWILKTKKFAENKCEVKMCVVGQIFGEIRKYEILNGMNLKIVKLKMKY